MTPLLFPKQLLLSALAALLFFGPLASTATGQIAPLPGASKQVIAGQFFWGNNARGSRSDYDSTNGVRLVVSAYGPVWGIFVDADGAAVTAPFLIASSDNGFAHFPDVTFSPHLTDGANGLGAFAVTWNGNPGNGNHVFGRVVSYNASGSGHLVGPIFQLSDGEATYWEVGHTPSMAYSPISRAFVLVWRTMGYDIRVRSIPVNGSGIPQLGAVTTISSGHAQYPSIAYNPVTDQFGVAYTGFPLHGGATYVVFATVNPAGVRLSRDTFAFAANTYITNMAVNNTTGRYLVTWSQGDGTRAAEFGPDATQTGVGHLSTSVGGYDSGSVAYLPASNTFLLTGHDMNGQAGGVELSSRGGPIAAGLGLNPIPAPGTPEYSSFSGTFYPWVSAHGPLNRWTITFSYNLSSIRTHVVTTATTNGGGHVALGVPPVGGGPAPPPPPPPPPPPTVCTTAKPGADWICVNGGWTPPPPGQGGSPPSGCQGAAPFPGAVCVNGGWVPGGGGGQQGGGGSCPGTAPFPGAICVDGGWVPGGVGAPPPSSGCPGTAPFPGAVCVDGGWVPGGGSTPPPSSGCPGTAPFPGAVCVNGGWVPGGGSAPPPSSGCPGTAPFPGAVCVNGGWVPGGGTPPPSSGCPGTAPFPGAVCVNGGWVPGGGTPPSSGCPGTAPFPGAVCVDGGWVPGGGQSPSPPSPPPGNCSSPAPGAGWACISGGWLPPGHPQNPN